MNNDTKTRLQQEEFSALKDSHRVILRWATGCGKSKMAVDLINYNVNPLVSGKLVHKALFVVAERAHIKNWEDEFDKWHLDRSHAVVDICCYASLKKYADYSYDILVLDEAHHAFSEKRMAALERLRNNLMPAANIYLLSATLPPSKQDMIEGIFGKFITSTITLRDAVRSDILPDPKVYVVAMELDDKKADQKIMVNKANDSSPVVSWDKRMKYLAKKLPCVIKCTKRQKYAYYSDTMEYWKQRYERSKNQFQRNLWVNTGCRRKRFLGELKTDAVKQLLSIIPRRMKTVCFCASVAQAESISVSETISSKRPPKWNQAVIEGFNKGINRRIYAVGMITEGMNLNGINAGIITQLDGKERLFIQKQGRVMRAGDPVSFIFYFKDTQDENYLKTALENIDAKYVQHININQLKTIKL